MVCKKIRKAREYPSQSKRSASLRRCIQRGTVQSRCTTQVHGDRKNAYLLVCCQHFSLNTLDTASSRCSAMCIYPRDDLLHLRDYYLINYPGHKSTQSGTTTYSSFPDFVLVWLLTKPSELLKEICAQLFCVYHFGVCNGAGKHQKHQAMQPVQPIYLVLRCSKPWKPPKLPKLSAPLLAW